MNLREQAFSRFSGMVTKPYRHIILQQMDIVLRQVTIIPNDFGRIMEIVPQVWIFLNKLIGYLQTCELSTNL